MNYRYRISPHSTSEDEPLFHCGFGSVVSNRGCQRGFLSLWVLEFGYLTTVLCWLADYLVSVPDTGSLERKGFYPLSNEVISIFSLQCLCFFQCSVSELSDPWNPSTADLNFGLLSFNWNCFYKFASTIYVTYLGYLVVDLHWSRWVLSGDVLGQCCLRTYVASV